MSAIKLVRRGSSAAAAPPVTGGLPFYGSWPAASGPWPLPWTTVLVNGGSVVQSNGVGVIQRPNNGFTGVYPSTAAVTDVDVRISVNYQYAITSGNSSSLHCLLRWAGGMGIGSASNRPASCYGLRFVHSRNVSGIYVDSLTLYAADVNGVQTTLHTLTGVPTTSVWLRFQVYGDVLRFKIWSIANPEPASWLHETTDVTHTSTGYVSLASFDNTYTQSYNIHSFALTAPV